MVRYKGLCGDHGSICKKILCTNPLTWLLGIYPTDIFVRVQKYMNKEYSLQYCNIFKNLKLT